MGTPESPRQEARTIEGQKISEEAKKREGEREINKIREVEDRESERKK